MSKVTNIYLLLLLLIAIACGGFFLYGHKLDTQNKNPSIIKGPSTPPPGYETSR